VKIASTVARYLLGLMLTVFGLNGFLQFIHQSPPADPFALQFLGSAVGSHFASFFFAVQLIAGLLLLSCFFVPLALILLAAEICNILAYHLTMDPKGIGAGLFAAILWLVVFLHYRLSFRGVLAAKPVLEA
jgi:putative oxidoreductase